MYHGEKTKHRKKRKYEKGGVFLGTSVGEKETRSIGTKGNGKKIKLLKTKYVNVTDAGKNMVCEILAVNGNPANKEFTRRNVITKGAILTAKTPDGKELKVKITSRPGQIGVLNAVLVK